MKHLLKTTLFLGLLSWLISATSYSGAQATSPNNSLFQSELKQGVCAYQAGNFPSAQQHFERAYQLDATQAFLPLFIARARLFQYQPGIQTAGNIEKAQAALKSYETILLTNPNSKEATAVIYFLYRELKQEDQARKALANYERLDKESGESSEVEEKAERKDKAAIVSEINNFIQSGVFKKEAEFEPDWLVSPPDFLLLLPSPPPPPPPPGVKPRPSSQSSPPRLQLLLHSDSQDMLPESDRRSVKEREAKRNAKLPWKLFAPNNEGFTVQMPSPVTVDNNIPDGRAYTVFSEGIAYQVFWMKSTSAPMPIDESLRVGTVALANADKLCSIALKGDDHTCEVKAVRKVNLNNLQGGLYRTLTATYCGKTSVRMFQVISTGTRDYVISVDAGEDDPRAIRFLESFALKGEAAGQKGGR